MPERRLGRAHRALLTVGGIAVLTACGGEPYGIETGSQELENLVQHVHANNPEALTHVTEVAETWLYDVVVQTDLPATKKNSYSVAQDVCRAFLELIPSEAIETHMTVQGRLIRETTGLDGSVERETRYTVIAGTEEGKGPGWKLDAFGDPRVCKARRFGEYSRW
jgi:hypothetical protein